MNSTSFNLAKTSKTLICYLVIIYTLLFITISTYITAAIIKFIVLSAAYLSLMKNSMQYVSRATPNAILKLHYHHPKDWKASYSNNNIEDIVISRFFVSQLFIILTIDNITTNKRHNEIIVSDQMEDYSFNYLHSAISLLKFHKDSAGL